MHPGNPHSPSRIQETALSRQSEELLNNEERVLRPVTQRGGRMTQADVADELGWTAVTTSQVTKRLREDDELGAVRLGRENVLVPDHLPHI